jgi:outer membrane protein
MRSKNLSLGLAITAIGLCAQPLTATAAQGDWLLRGGLGIVDPKSNNLTVGLPDALTGLGGDTVGEIQVDTGASATIEVTYMVTDHLGVELLAAWPFSHDVDLDIAAFDGGEGVGFPGGTFDAGKVKHLPPTLSLQYHFNPDGRFRPYVGAGINFTTLFDEKARGVLSDIGVTKLELDDSWGLAGQLGIDIGITDRWFGNFSIRYIDIDADAELTAGGTTLDIGTVEIDPFVYQAQIGYRFGK